MDDLLTRFDAIEGRRIFGGVRPAGPKSGTTRTVTARRFWRRSDGSRAIIYRQFGRLLTPLVDGIRVSGTVPPCTFAELQDAERRLVLLDGEGLGHSARDTSVSTRITERFKDVDLILLVDSAESPLLATPLGLLRSVGSSGHGQQACDCIHPFRSGQG